MPTWRQLRELPNLFHRSTRYPICTALGLIIVCGYAVQWLCSLGGPGRVEDSLGLSQTGLRTGCLWQLLTYPFLHDLANPLGIMLIVIGLMTIGRELENIIGAKHFLLLFFGATISSGLANSLRSGGEPVFGAWPSVFAISLACAEALPEFRLSAAVFGTVRYRLLGAALLAVLFTGWLIDWFPFGHGSAFANLIGAGVGWFYIRFLGFGAWLPGEVRLRIWLRKRRQIAEMPARRYIVRFVDPILEKIQTEGLSRLTGSERRILRKARQKTRRKL